MTIKIQAHRILGENDDGSTYKGVIVRESDWRRIMAVVKAADNSLDDDGVFYIFADLEDAVKALRKHLVKRK